MYKRIVLKLSGESLAGSDRKGFDAARVDEVAEVIAKLRANGVQTAVIMGGGNIWRGRFTDEMNPVNADQMGMLATVINALCVCDALNRKGCPAKVFTAQEMTRFADLYTRDRAIEQLEAGKVIFIAGGSGNPFFTTDTAAALRCAELNADAVFKGTTVDGIYDRNPNLPGAVLLKDITYAEAVEKQLKIMDTTAFLLCREQNVPEIRVFNMNRLENIVDVALGSDIGTVAHP